MRLRSRCDRERTDPQTMESIAITKTMGSIVWNPFGIVSTAHRMSP